MLANMQIIRVNQNEIKEFNISHKIYFVNLNFPMEQLHIL